MFLCCKLPYSEQLSSAPFCALMRVWLMYYCSYDWPSLARIVPTMRESRLSQCCAFMGLAVISLLDVVFIAQNCSCCNRARSLMKPLVQCFRQINLELSTIGLSKDRWSEYVPSKEREQILQCEIVVFVNEDCADFSTATCAWSLENTILLCFAMLCWK